MSNDKNINEEIDLNGETAEENCSCGADTEQAVVSKEDYDKLETKLKEQTAKSEEYLSMAQRGAAEFDNFKKRTIKEKEAIYTDAFADAVTAFLPVVDNMERAVAAVNGDSNDIKTLKEGVDMVYKQLKDAFVKLGVEEIEAEGKNFDPESHNAVMHIEDEAYGESQIVEVFQKGYKLKEKVLRHSMVKVAN